MDCTRSGVLVFCSSTLPPAPDIIKMANLDNANNIDLLKSSIRYLIMFFYLIFMRTLRNKFHFTDVGV